jgi:biopolymer transport protein ExbD
MEELNLVPYLDVMVNLIIFMLVTISAFLPLGILSIYPPASGSGVTQTQTPEETPKPQLTLTVFITRDGFTVAGIGGVLPPITLKPNGEYDLENLTLKAAEIKDTYPNERQVIIAAEKEIRYEVLVKVMDALRNKGDRVLFDQVKLSPGLRT